MECNWKRHPYYDDILISDNGRVLSYKSGKWVELKPYDNNRGYLRVTIGHSSHSDIHRLVAETYIPNFYEKNQVNHKDGNKQNNKTTNLEWCTRSENIRHGYATGLIRPKQKGRRIRIVETNNVYQSMTECAKAIGGTVSGVSNCIHGYQKTYKGYHFENI